MELTIEYQNGIYTGEVKDGVPHGHGTLKISDSETFEGYWQEGKRFPNIEHIYGISQLLGVSVESILA